LSLVSGRPLSFVMDLYEPLYLQRPEARLELFAGLTPQTYAEARAEMQAVRGGLVEADSADARRPMPAAAKSGYFRSPHDASDSVLLPVESQEANATIVAQASAGQIGELFEYALSDITLARQSSAMVPIITDPIEVT